MDPSFEIIWRFVRGELEPAAFETWLYADDQREHLFGHQLYLELISADYRHQRGLDRIRGALADFARSKAEMGCECITLPATTVLSMADPGRALDHFREICRRGQPYWWLGMSECTACSTHWLVAQEERQNEVYLLRRIDDPGIVAGVVTPGRWPGDFDRYETLLSLGRAAGHRVRFVDPLGASSLAATIVDLARERPGITVSELAELLNLDQATAAALADQAITLHGVRIDRAGETWH